MSRPRVGGLDYATGEIIDREMNDEEYAQYLADKAAAPVYGEVPNGAE